MCLTCTAAILAGAATVWAQMGGGMFGGGAASQFKGVWSPVVGDGAEYQMTSTRQPAFWQDESFDHWIRSDAQFERIRMYIEQNPVKAGLVRNAEQWKWSSAHK
jgi:hypothetical protein